MTDAEPTPDHILEDVWVIQALYAPDAAETRAPVRPHHLARLARLKATGVVIEAGGFHDMSESLLIVRAESEAAALAIAREDVYVQQGVWVEFRARRFGRVSLDT